MPPLDEMIKEAASTAGFDHAGIAPIGNFPEHAAFSKWIDSGYAGEMNYLEAKSESGDLKRTSLEEVAPWARSVVVCVVNYNTTHPYSTQFRDSKRGWISRYAWSEEDYHDSVLRRLTALEQSIRDHTQLEFQSRCYVDTGPIVERIYAKYSGVGWIGKNTCLINQQLGSWLFLGVMLTSLDLSPDLPAPDRCGTCTRCLDACPTDAFIGPYQLDATKCISYLTIEKRGSIPEPIRGGIGFHVFGCDICQDVCPWNRKAPVTTAAQFQPRQGFVNPALDWLAEMKPEEFREKFRGSPVRRAKLSGLRRNAVIAMGNSGNTKFLGSLKKLVDDEDPIVAEHARWAISRLRS